MQFAKDVLKHNPRITFLELEKLHKNNARLPEERLKIDFILTQYGIKDLEGENGTSIYNLIGKGSARHFEKSLRNFRIVYNKGKKFVCKKNRAQYYANKGSKVVSLKKDPAISEDEFKSYCNYVAPQLDQRIPRVLYRMYVEDKTHTFDFDVVLDRIANDHVYKSNPQDFCYDIKNMSKKELMEFLTRGSIDLPDSCEEFGDFIDLAYEVLDTEFPPGKLDEYWELYDTEREKGNDQFDLDWILLSLGVSALIYEQGLDIDEMDLITDPDLGISYLRDLPLAKEYLKNFKA